MYEEKIEKIIDKKFENISFKVEKVLKDYRRNFIDSINAFEELQSLVDFDITAYRDKLEEFLKEDDKTENKKYKCVKDLQNTEWCIDEINTIEEWRELAIGWSESDGFNETAEYIYTIPRTEIMDFISDNWQIVFEEEE